MNTREQPNRGGSHVAKARPPRTRSIGVTLVGLLLVPLLALVALWAFLASTTLGNAVTELRYNGEITADTATTTGLLIGLEQERLHTFLWLSSPRRPPVSQLTAVRRADDAAIAAYERSPGQLQSAVLALKQQLASISRIRAAADAGTLSAAAAFEGYSAVVDALWDVLASAPESDITQYRQTLAALESGRAVEQFTREQVIVAAAAAGHGRLAGADRALLAAAAANQDLLIGDALTGSTGQFHASLQRLDSSPLHTQVTALENQIAAGTGSGAQQQTALRDWGPAANAWLAKLNGTTESDAPHLAALAASTGRRLLIEAVLAGGLGLLAVAASVFLMVRFGRGIRKELTGLHDSAQRLAEERLPSVVERLRDGEDVDVAAEAPPPPAGRITEVASVAQAFGTVQRTAVQAAVGQADLRKGINQVFLNLSLRNQSLLHRQLGMLDSMERATNDPGALADLFRLDHLTTRMRRHAEGLIILSGSTPARGWRDPVPVLDVLRAAIAEVEDYVRVDVASESPEAVVGGAVNDVIHLVAELIENATTFSPPNTRVEIRADLVGSGLAVEIEDRGLGLTSGELAEINTRLASPPEFDLANSNQLGLFVVGQLAARHGIRISLRESAYGGTTAIVLLPRSIIASDGVAAWPATGPAGRSALARVTGAAHPGGAGEPAADPDQAPAFSLTGRPWFDAAPPAPGGPGAAGEPDYRGPWEPPPRPEPSARPPWGAAAPGVGPAPAAGPEPEPEQAGPASDGTHRGLPRRVRQASLAPQLRNRAPSPGGPAGEPAGEPAGRSPDDMRSTMSALQLGWERGRVDDLDFPDDDWPDGTPGAAGANDGGGS